MKKGRTFGGLLFGKKKHKRQMRRVKQAEKEERRSPNTIKFFYPDKVVVTLGYETRSDLFESLKKEAENLLKRYRYKLPIPRKVIIKIDRRLR